ncbi:hypothetical protein [Methylobacterium oryzisoli]|uniref:hypothetical protein n=1 Tax=Methylobacterium oryzisoli TaxID=3385502 RepID=UPI003891BE61
MRASAIATLLMMSVLTSVAAAQSETPPANPASAGKPANLCQELAAFVHQPQEAKKSDSQPAQLAAAVQAPKNADQPAKPSDAAGQPQQASGISGQVSSSGPGASGPQGATQNTAAPSGATVNVAPAQQPGQAQPAPQAQAAPPAGKPSPDMITKAEDAIGSNDLSRCRSAAQQMRRAGVVMPAPLLALSAMNPKLLEAAQRP